MVLARSECRHVGHASAPSTTEPPQGRMHYTLREVKVSFMEAPVGTPVTIALVNDYDIVVIGMAHILQQYQDRVVIAELDTNVAVSDLVDIVLYMGSRASKLHKRLRSVPSVRRVRWERCTCRGPESAGSGGPAIPVAAHCADMHTTSPGAETLVPGRASRPLSARGPHAARASSRA